MAFEIIGKYIAGEKEQEEIIEKQLIAGDDGVVEEVEILKQIYAKTWLEVVVEQDRTTDNQSYFKITGYLNGTAGSVGDGFYMQCTNGYTMLMDEYYRNDPDAYNRSDTYTERVYVAPGETVRKEVAQIRTRAEMDSTSSSDPKYLDLNQYHKIDGSYVGARSTKYRVAEPNFYWMGVYYLYDIVTLVEYNNSNGYLIYSGYFDVDFTDRVLNIDRSIHPLVANDFTDEENPSFTYNVFTDTVLWGSFDDPPGTYNTEDTVELLQAALSFDGETLHIGYRDIPIDGNQYTFNLTDEERDVLRQQSINGFDVPVYYLIKVGRRAKYPLNSAHKYPEEYVELVSKTQRTLSIINSTPRLNPQLRDVNSDTVALTGNENIFVQYESMVEFETGAIASKYATIVSQSVQCGSKIVTDMYQGVIDDIEDGSFIFNATDSRGLVADTVVVTNTAMIPYITPTCTQKVKIQLAGEVGAVVTVEATGNYYNGSFGVADNELIIEVRYAENDGEYGEWIKLTGTPTLENGTYKLAADFTGLSYESAYTFQTRATDKLNVVESSSFVAKLIPVFDWSDSDFNFNVPVNINSDEINMHDKTIIRHDADTNNTVLSANDGHIYLRPGGTNKTNGETVFYNNGSIDFNGATNFNGVANFNNSFTIGGYILNDYVVETGSEAMGSNGTWYWQKWLSGKSEAWGCRNFGNMAVSTAWGSLYRSAVFTQDLPEDVFKTTPETININFVHTDAGGWIAKYQNTAPSAVTTGSFVVVRPVSGNITPTNIGFYVVGQWY